MVDIEATARGYLRCSDSLSPEHFDPDSAWNPENNADERAYQTVNDAIRHGPPELAWELVTTILRLAPDDRLGLYAAGPLEDVVRRWGTALVDRIEALASADERFQWALAGIWLKWNGGLSADVVQRIVAASGNAIRPL